MLDPAFSPEKHSDSALRSPLRYGEVVFEDAAVGFAHM